MWYPTRRRKAGLTCLAEYEVHFRSKAMQKKERRRAKGKKERTGKH